MPSPTTIYERKIIFYTYVIVNSPEIVQAGGDTAQITDSLKLGKMLGWVTE